MSTLARAALLIVLCLGFVRLAAADADEAAVLRAKAERGNALAQYNLGLLYEQGRQVPADPAEAFAWLSLASESGATGKALDSLLGNISDAQLAEGRRRLGLYRTALSNKGSTTSTHSTPKLAPRGFVMETAPATPPPPAAEPPATTPVTTPATNPATVPATPPATTASTTASKAPDAAAPPLATTPAEGAGVTDLAQTRKDLEKTSADLSAANAELATLRATVTRLEAAAAEAKATETRLTADLKAAQLELNTLKPVATAAPAEKTKAEDSTPHQP